MLALKLLINKLNNDSDDYNDEEVVNQNNNLVAQNKNKNIFLKNIVISGFSKFQDGELKGYKKAVFKDPRYKILSSSFKKYIWEKNEINILQRKIFSQI